MNIFRLAGDLAHLISIVVLLLKIYATKSCSGISLKTQVLYALVFLVDFFTDFISLYNSLMKVAFFVSSLAIVDFMRSHPIIKRSYDQSLDTCCHYFLILGCFVLALFIHDKFTFQEVFRAFSIYLEAVAILPQLVLLQRSENIDNLTAQYVFFLGAYRALCIVNWIYCYFSGPYVSRWISCAGLVQTALYADFFYYYYVSWKNNSNPWKKIASAAATAATIAAAAAVTVALSHTATRPRPR